MLSLQYQEGWIRMDWFKNNVFKKFYNKYHQDADSYKDTDGKGILQRFEEGKYKYWDDETLPLIDNFAEKTVFPESLEEGLLIYAEESLGADLFTGAPFKRRLALKYFLRLCRLRCTPLGFETLIRLTDFGEMIFYTVDVKTFFDNPLPFAGVNAWYEYEIQITGNMLTLLPEQARKLQAASKWNEPINCRPTVTGILYNGNYLPIGFVEFFFDRSPPFPFPDVGRSHHLFIDNQDITFSASLNESTGVLTLSGDFHQYYELDEKYFAGQGHLMFRYQGEADTFPPFDSYLADSVTANAFRITWENVADAVKYYVDIGTVRGNPPNTIDSGIIDGKIYSRVDVGNVNEFVADANVQEDTVYFYQVFAENAEGKLAYSSINWVLTKTTMPQPQNLNIISQQGQVFVLGWDNVAEATGYKIDVSELSDFSTFVHQDLTVQNIENQRINAGNIGTFYARIKAIKNHKNYSLSIESESDYSDMITINL